MTEFEQDNLFTIKVTVTTNCVWLLAFWHQNQRSITANTKAHDPEPNSPYRTRLILYEESCSGSGTHDPMIIPITLHHTTCHSSCHFYIWQFRTHANRHIARQHVLQETKRLFPGYEPPSTKQSGMLCSPARCCLPSTAVPLHRSATPKNKRETLSAGPTAFPSRRVGHIRDTSCSSDATQLKPRYPHNYASSCKTMMGLLARR
jgi:hypothetical protein